MTSSTSMLSSQDELRWFSQLRDDSPYGIYQGDDEKVWLMLQPTLFYNQRKRLINGYLMVGRIEQSRDYSVLSLSGVKQIENHGISRMHATLLPMEYGVAVQDVGSTNGSRLNGLPLIAGRSYNLNQGDLLELGRLILKVHIIEMDVFLKGIRNLILQRFPDEVQDELVGMVAPAETLLLLLQRLPNRTSDQMQVISVFKERNEPLSLEKLHERINKVLGTKPDLQNQFADLEGDVTVIKAPKKPPSAPLETVRLGDNKKQEEPHTPIEKASKRNVFSSEVYVELCRELQKLGLESSKGLEALLARAQGLEDFAEREMAMNLIIPMLTQLSAWLPTVGQDIPD